MLYYENLDDALPFFKALSSELRVQILKLLTVQNDMNLNDLAKRLGITNGVAHRRWVLKANGALCDHREEHRPDRPDGRPCDGYCH